MSALLLTDEALGCLGMGKEQAPPHSHTALWRWSPTVAFEPLLVCVQP